MLVVQDEVTATTVSSSGMTATGVVLMQFVRKETTYDIVTVNHNTVGTVSFVLHQSVLEIARRFMTLVS